MNLRTPLAWLCVALCVGVSVACFGKAKRRPGTAPRNVLLVTAAGLRKDHLSAYMYARPTSAWPATEEERRQGRALSLDDLAEQGVVFADASSGAPRTFPALCELMTGTRAAVACDAKDERALESEASCLAESFEAAGFRTLAFVAGAPLQQAQGLDQGFQKWFWKYSDMAVLDLARQWIAELEPEADKPWFIWVHLAGGEPPHDPRSLPSLPTELPGALDFARLYSDPKYTGAADGSIAYLARLKSGEASANEQDRARLVDLYDGEVARLAASLRTLALALRNQDEQGKRWNETVLVFAGVHGLELGDSGPREWGSDSLSAAVTATPLFLRHPLSLTGSRVMAEPVGLEDVAPTLCDWFGLPALDARQHAIQGRSLLPLVDTYVKKPFEHRDSFAELRGATPSRSLRTREYAIVETQQGGAAQIALYDRIADPGELHDIAASRPEVVLEMRAALDRASFESGHRP
ncbi:MAG: sulfatase-like hydrolase/transferase [Planctomycetota bacterium]